MPVKSVKRRGRKAGGFFGKVGDFIKGAASRVGDLYKGFSEAKLSKIVRLIPGMTPYIGRFKGPVSNMLEKIGLGKGKKRGPKKGKGKKKTNKK